MRPKLYQYRVDFKKAAEYELSSVEMNQEQLINVDFDMGMPLNLIDRDIYHPDSDPTVPTKDLQARLEKLKLSLLDEKDRFLLSYINTIESPVKKAQDLKMYPKKLPASYRLIHREEKWGQDYKDPLAVRQVEEGVEEIINTTADRGEKVRQREAALNQIERRFAGAKRVCRGITKPGCHDVVATEVWDFKPMMQMLS